MSSKYSHDVVATVGSYVDNNSGEERKRYQKVGAAFTDEDGRVSLKIDAVPCSPSWSGWLSLYTKKDVATQTASPPSNPQRTSPYDARLVGQDDIPF